MAATPGCPRLTARLIRWLGLGSNPLRRASDRAEAWIRAGLLAVFLITGPLAAPAAGGWVSHLYVAAVSARAAHAHAVRAILLQPARAAAGLTMAGRATAVWVTARWDSSGGPPRTGEVSAPAGSPAGTVVTVWLDPSGTVIGPSPPDTQADDAVPVAAATLVVMAFALLGLLRLAQRLLNARRLAAWETAWSATGPRWTGYRS
jgi:hypothetical protein